MRASVCLYEPIALRAYCHAILPGCLSVYLSVSLSTYNDVIRKWNALFNGAFNTFYLRLYGVTYMVKHHSDSERGNPLPSHRLLFRLAARDLYMHHSRDRMTYTTAFGLPVVEQRLEREIAQWVHHMKGRSGDPSHHERTFLPRSYISLLRCTHTTWPHCLPSVLVTVTHGLQKHKTFVIVSLIHVYKFCSWTPPPPKTK